MCTARGGTRPGGGGQLSRCRLEVGLENHVIKSDLSFGRVLGDSGRIKVLSCNKNMKNIFILSFGGKTVF